MKHVLLSSLLLAAGPALAQQAPAATKAATHKRSTGSSVAVFVASLTAVTAALAARKRRAQQQK